MRGRGRGGGLAAALDRAASFNRLHTNVVAAEDNNSMNPDSEDNEQTQQSVKFSLDEESSIMSNSQLPAASSNPNDDCEDSNSVLPDAAGTPTTSAPGTTSDAEGGGTAKKKKRRRTNMEIFEQLKNSVCSTIKHANQLFIYKWPQDDPQGELYVLQEHMSEYLDVKSFKRKHPDLFRRTVEIKEREFLKDGKIVTEAQCDLGLTALKLRECLELIEMSYPDKLKELNSYLADRNRKAAAAAALKLSKDLAEKRKNDWILYRERRAAMTEDEKFREMSKKAAKAVSSYNAQLQKERKEERQAYYDLQTMRVHIPIREPPKQIINPVTGNSSNKLGHYPVAILDGQYQNYYKKYTSDELKYLPLNTAIYALPTPMPYKYASWLKQQRQKLMNNCANSHAMLDQSTDMIDDDYDDDDFDVDLLDDENRPKSAAPVAAAAASAVATAEAAPTADNNENVAESASDENKPAAPKRPSGPCYVCNKPEDPSDADERLINCSACERSSHPACLELNPSLVNWATVRNYAWQCMECKKCSTCNEPHDEDKMMFCDRCDRGFHTYCVGVRQVPQGSWICKRCSFVVTSASKQMMDVSSPGTPLNLTSSNSGRALQQLSRTTPGSGGDGTVKRGRGRPPGSLNKPKDPNAIRLKLEKKKSGSLLNLSGGGGDQSFSAAHRMIDYGDDDMSNDLMDDDDSN